MNTGPSGPANLLQLFRERVKRYQTRDALIYFKEGRWARHSWNDWAERASFITLGLYEFGVQPGDRVGLLSENRPEWSFADFGILGLGAVVVPIYPTSSARDIAYILENAGIRILFVSTREQLERLRPLLSEQTALKRVIVFDFSADESDRIISLGSLFEKGRMGTLNNPSFYEQLIEKISPEDLATIIYTSGTTGAPKGVMLTHTNFVANIFGSSKVIPVGENDLALSILPLSHIFERLAGYYFMMTHGARLAYARNMQTVAEDMVMIRPTVMAAVPRFYEKVYAGIQDKLSRAPRWKRRVFDWSVRIGSLAMPYLLQRKPLPTGLAWRYQAADRLVFSAIRRGLGGRMRFFISGGAPLSKSLAEFFFMTGVLILEGYGLTETSPVIAANTPDSVRFGTVGRPLDIAEVKISEEGEILTRGPCVMKGYYRNEQATQEAMRGGWFHTGDVGRIDEDGYLVITDRIKDLIVLSGGKKAAPQNIEALILQEKSFTQAVVIGDKRNYLVALLVPSKRAVDECAQQKGIGGMEWEALLKNSSLLECFETRLRQRIKDLAPYEQVKYFALLSRELTQEAGELTPTLKVKRRVVMEKYADLIEGLYQKGEGWKKAGE